jgi:hypothetical protein
MDTIYKTMIACTHDYIHNMIIEYERDNNFETII